MPTLLWFRRDLRLHDLPALLDAAASRRRGAGLLRAGPTAEGVVRPAQAAIPLRRVARTARRTRRQADGDPGRPSSEFPALAKAVGATAVHVSADFTPFGRRRDDAVRDALGDMALEASGSPYLVSPGRVVKDDGDALQGVHAVLRRVAQARLAGARRSRSASSAQLDRPGRRRRAASTSPTPASNSNCPPVRRRRCRQWKKFVEAELARLRRRPQPARSATPAAGCRRT